MATSHGLLHDLSGKYTRYLNPGASWLEEHAERRAIILLADAGMGKSFELGAEIERRQPARQYVERLNLGEYSSPAEVKDAVRDAASASGSRSATWQARLSATAAVIGNSIATAEPGAEDWQLAADHQVPGQHDRVPLQMAARRHSRRRCRSRLFRAGR